ncbi:uncharacterized protein LOC110859114 [Folsomia candida]|uniref:uncharacterized protein LOC110859114 n=1 Tax=Folsomia candida TaxID=158441 RepID=UPI000B909E88|nr:uncharacterized protein LOC110859114 [Folsomia candida]
MDMETKSLRLQFSKGKVEQEYNLELDLPDKVELIQLLELPPHYILSKNDVTFSTGLFGQMPHAIKLIISRDYQDLYMGLFIKIGEKSDQQVQITEVKGIFQSLSEPQFGPPSSPSTSCLTVETPTVLVASAVDNNADDDDVDLSVPDDDPDLDNQHHHVHMWNYQPPAAPVHHQYPVRVHNMAPTWVNHGSIMHNNNGGYSPHHHHHHPHAHALSRSSSNLSNRPASSSSSSSPDKKKKGMLFSFQKQSPEMRLDEMKQFQYYRSYSQTWPVKGSRVKLTMKVVGIKYSAIVDDDEMINPDLKMGTSMFNAEPFFMSEYCSDVKLKIGSTFIPGHKIVLSARSDFFNRMFSNPMRETAQGIVELEDDESHFIEILRFIYLGRVENIGDHVHDLFVLADKYQIQDLSVYAEKYLLSKLSVENVIEMFDLSHSVGKQGLLAKRSKELIMWNKEKFAPDLDTFKEFFNKYPELIFEILKL